MIDLFTFALWLISPLCVSISLSSSPLTLSLSLSLPADLNECGLKPRPCKHRCMNTYGSYKCYCLNGYMLMPDGTCGSESASRKHTHTLTSLWLRTHTVCITVWNVDIFIHVVPFFPPHNLLSAFVALMCYCEASPHFTINVFISMPAQGNADDICSLL